MGVLDRYIYVSKCTLSKGELDTNDDIDVGEMDMENIRISTIEERRSTGDIRNSSAGRILLDQLDNRYKMKKKKQDGEPEDEDDGKISLTTQDLNKAIVIKYYLQWALLFAVHGLVFWYWPMHGTKVA